MTKLPILLVFVSSVATADNKEVANLAKVMSGAWTCDGNVFLPDGKTMKLAGKIAMALELGGSWIHESMDATVGPIPVKFDSYITYDAPLKKWRRIEVDNRGNHEIGVADAMVGGKVEWVAEKTAPDGKVSSSRTHFDGSDPKLLHVVSESTTDKKTWTKAVDVSCKR